jgi:hypothetical protein
MLAKGKAPKVLTAAQAGAGCRDSRGERAERLRHQALTGKAILKIFMAVLVLDKRKKPRMPCSDKRARKLLESGRGRVHRLIPFAIRLVDREVSDSELQSLDIKLDPFQHPNRRGRGARDISHVLPSRSAC